MALKEVKVKPDGKLFLNLNSLRENVYNLSKEYRCIQLIHNGLMDVVSELLFVVHGSISHFALFCNYAVIKNWSTSSPSMMV